MADVQEHRKICPLMSPDVDGDDVFCSAEGCAMFDKESGSGECGILAIGNGLNFIGKQLFKIYFEQYKNPKQKGGEIKNGNKRQQSSA